MNLQDCPLHKSTRESATLSFCLHPTVSILAIIFVLTLTLSACSLFPTTPAPLTSTLLTTSTTPVLSTVEVLSASPIPSTTPTWQPVCTPPPCAANESYFCTGECPGGCGTTCATHTPSPPTEQAPSPTPTPTPLRFAVIGDFGLAGQPEADVAALAASWQPELILTTGDNNYPEGEAATIDANIGQYYHAYIYPYTGKFGQGAEQNRFFPSLGNHDWYNIQAHYDYFTLPGNERYYDFIWGPVHFFALDSDSREPDGVGASSVQAQWLQDQLAASTSPWQVVYFHHAPYSSATHGDTEWMQWPFADWGADVVLAGHDHVYERLLVEGLPYFTIGCSGNPSLYWFINPRPESVVRYREDFGALLVEASETSLDFSFQTRAGTVIDTYRLERASQ
jgi:hypothetical protein